MAEQIGIKLALDGAGAVQSGLRSVSDALGNLGTRTVSVADAFRGLAPTIAATFSVGAITAWARSTINAIDAMNDLADATGATVEQISALDGFARRTGTTLDSVGSILVKFNGVLNQTAGADNGVSQALRAIGLDTAALRRADPVQALQQTAQALANYADDANKARLVQELFGKSIREAAPILKDLAEAGQLNATVTARQAAEAERFNRQLAQFQANATDAGRAIVNGLLPTINQLLTQLRDGTEAYQSFWSAAIDLGLKVNPFKTTNENLTDTVAEIKRIRDIIAEMRGNPLPDILGRRGRAIAEYQQQLTLAESRERYLLRQLGREGGGRGAPPTTAPTRTVPSVPDPGRLNDAARARQAEIDIRAAQDLARLRREDQAQQDADAAARQMLAEERKREESFAQYLLDQNDEVTRTLIEHERMVADYARQMDQARLAELRLRADQELAQIARVDEAQNRAEDAARRAAQERLDADARESLSMIQRYDDAVTAAEQAYRQQAAIEARALQERLDADARSSLFLQERYDDAVSAAEQAYRQQAALEARALQERLDADARSSLFLEQRYDDAVNAAEEAYQRQADSFAEYQRTLSDETTRALIADNEAVRRLTEQDAAARQRAMDSLGDRIGQMRLESEASQLAAEQSISLAEAIELITIARLREMQARMYRPGGEGWREVQTEIDARLELLRLMGDERVRDANLRAAQQAANAWQRTVDQISQSLADALMNGGMKAGEALKRYFSTLILQPIIQALVNPVARTIVGGLGLAGAAGTAAAGAAGGGSAATGAGALLATGTAYGSFFGAGASMALGGGTSAALAAANAAISGGSVGAGLSIGAGALAPWVAAGALILNGLSRRLKDTGIRGTFGGEAGFSGNQFAFYRGGFLRSNRTTLSALDPDTQALLAGSFNELRSTTAAMARELGLAASALDDYTRSIDISLRGLTQEQIAERLQQELGLVADEMARLVGGAGATADSLRQLYQAVMSERAQLETQLLQLQGNTAELRRRERDALHESNRALYDRITALQDERAAMDATLSAAQTAIQQQISASQAAANAARQAAEAYRGAGLTLLDTARALRGDAAPGASAAAAYRAGLAAAQGGDLGAMQNLSGLAQSYAESLRGSASSRAQYLAGTRGIAAELEAVAGTAGGLAAQRGVQASLLDVNTAALQVLAEDLSSGKLTVDLLRQHQTLLGQITQQLGTGGAIALGLATLDSNVDGLLTLDELRTGLAGKATDAEIQALIRTVDTNGDGQITQLELAVASIRAGTDASGRLLAAIVSGFGSLDRNVDGLLTLDELRTGLAGKATDAEIQALIRTVDTNGDGQITQLELAVASIRAGTDASGRLLAAIVSGFGSLDRNVDGLLTLDELRTGLAGKATDAEIQALIKRADANADGQIAKAEALRVLQVDSVKRLAGVDEGTSGVVQGQQAAGDLLASSDLTLARVLARLSEPDANAALLAERVQSGNQLIADRLSSVIAAIGAQTAAQQAEIKRQQDLVKAQKDLESAASYFGTLQGSLSQAQATLAGTSPTTSVRVGTRRDIFGFSKGGIYEERTNPAYQTAIDAVNAAQQALAVYAPQVDQLREQIRSLGGVPQFAAGGLHSGGLRIVGERGPELEVTGPARYWSAADTASMLGNSQRRDEALVAEIRALRSQVARLEAAQLQTAVNTGKTQRLMQRVTRDGESMQVTDVTPAP